MSKRKIVNCIETSHGNEKRIKTISKSCYSEIQSELKCSICTEVPIHAVRICGNDHVLCVQCWMTLRLQKYRLDSVKLTKEGNALYRKFDLSPTKCPECKENCLDTIKETGKYYIRLRDIFCTMDTEYENSRKTRCDCGSIHESAREYLGCSQTGLLCKVTESTTDTPCLMKNYTLPVSTNNDLKYLNDHVAQCTGSSICCSKCNEFQDPQSMYMDEDPDMPKLKKMTMSEYSQHVKCHRDSDNLSINFSIMSRWSKLSSVSNQMVSQSSILLPKLLKFKLHYLFSLVSQCQQLRDVPIKCNHDTIDSWSDEQVGNLCKRLKYKDLQETYHELMHQEQEGLAGGAFYSLSRFSRAILKMFNDPERFNNIDQSFDDDSDDDDWEEDDESENDSDMDMVIHALVGLDDDE